MLSVFSWVSNYSVTDMKTYFYNYSHNSQLCRNLEPVHDLSRFVGDSNKMPSSFAGVEVDDEDDDAAGIEEDDDDNDDGDAAGIDVDDDDATCIDVDDDDDDDVDDDAAGADDHDDDAGVDVDDTAGVNPDDAAGVNASPSGSPSKTGDVDSDPVPS